MTVRKKMFIVMTFLLPFLMAALFTLPGLMVAKGMGEKHVAVLDGTGTLRDAFTNPNEKPKTETVTGRRNTSAFMSDIKVEYIDAHGQSDLTQTAKPYLDRMSGQD